MDDLVALTARLADKVLFAAGGRTVGGTSPSRGTRGPEAPPTGEGDAPVHLIPTQEPTLLERLEDGLPKGDSKEMDEAIDQEALRRLNNPSPSARAFAAIRLASRRAPADKAKVSSVLQEALKDEVLAPLFRP